MLLYLKKNYNSIKKQHKKTDEIQNYKYVALVLVLNNFVIFLK